MKTIPLLLALFVPQPSNSSPNSLVSKPKTETLITHTDFIQKKIAVAHSFELVQQLDLDVVTVRLDLPSDDRIKEPCIHAKFACAEILLRKGPKKGQLRVPIGFQQMEIEFKLHVQI